MGVSPLLFRYEIDINTIFKKIEPQFLVHAPELFEGLLMDLASTDDVIKRNQLMKHKEL